MYIPQVNLDEAAKLFNNVEVILCNGDMTSIERVVYWGILKDSLDCGYSDSTNAELASAFSCTRRTISRVIACLREKGYIDTVYGKANYRRIYPVL